MSKSMEGLIRNRKENMNKMYDALNEKEKYDLMGIMEDTLKPMYERAIELYKQGNTEDTESFILFIGGSDGVNNIIDLIVSTNTLRGFKASIKY